MKSLFRYGLRCRVGGAAWLLPVILLWGCSTSGRKGQEEATASSQRQVPIGADILHPGDRVRVVYNDIPDKIEPAELLIPETGILTLYLGVEVKFAGKPISALEREIESAYIDDKKLFRRITINIERVGLSVSVGGEVRLPGNVPYVGGMTVVSAINAAGGMTDYGAKGRVKVTRGNGDLITVDVGRAVDNPGLDQRVYPGDKVYVPRRGLGVGGL